MPASQVISLDSDFYVSNMIVNKEIPDKAAMKYRKEKSNKELLNDLDKSLSCLSLSNPRRKALELEKYAITPPSLSESTKAIVNEIITAPVVADVAAAEPRKRGRKPGQGNKIIEPTKTYNLRGKKN